MKIIFKGYHDTEEDNTIYARVKFGSERSGYTYTDIDSWTIEGRKEPQIFKRKEFINWICSLKGENSRESLEAAIPMTLEYKARSLA